MAHIKTKYFPILLFISAVTVEFCSAFFSVYGLTKLFSGASLAVGIMAGSLEFAKVISASYLYRYWKEIAKLFKTYMTVAVVILMLITSLGIYGFLSNAFQGSTLLLEKESSKLSLQEDEIARIKSDIESLKSDKADLQKNMNAELNGLVIQEKTRYSDVSRRAGVQKRYQTLITEKDNQISQNSKKIETLTQNISDAKVKMIDTGADVGPIIFVSKSLGVSVTTVVQYLILLFIIVFDPLALALIIAFNKLTLDRKEEEVEEIETPTPTEEKRKRNLEDLLKLYQKRKEESHKAGEQEQIPDVQIEQPQEPLKQEEPVVEETIEEPKVQTEKVLAHPVQTSSF